MYRETRQPPRGGYALRRRRSQPLSGLQGFLVGKPPPRSSSNSHPHESERQVWRDIAAGKLSMVRISGSTRHGAHFGDAPISPC